MRNLFNFILRYYFFFLFVLLQTAAITMVVQHNHYQRAFFVSSANILAGNVFKLTSGITDYLALKEINRQLAKENARLLNLTSGTFLKTDTLQIQQNDTVLKQRFIYLNAEVINNSVIRRNNFLTLNKGSRHGIEPDMGVITPLGVVGIVTNVSENFSSVISLLHKDMQISARLAKNNQIGTLIWEGINYRQATLTYIPTHVELNVGDTLVTSGFSVIFPPNILIGTIKSSEIRRGDNFFTAIVDLAIDFNNLKFVQVVKDLMSEELKQVEAHSATITR